MDSNLTLNYCSNVIKISSLCVGYRGYLTSAYLQVGFALEVLLVGRQLRRLTQLCCYRVDEVRNQTCCVVVRLQNHNILIQNQIKIFRTSLQSNYNDFEYFINKTYLRYRIGVFCTKFQRIVHLKFIKEGLILGEKYTLQ